jgi:hypothetical protein
LIALVSPGNSPGVTTTGFALTLAWPQPVLLAECSPAGGHLLAGYFGGSISADRGLWHLALKTRQGVDAAIAEVPNQVVVLDDQRLLLPGLRDPFLSTQLNDMWGHITEVFRHLPMDVIVDIGHVGADLPFELVRAADLVVMVMRPTLAQAAAAKPRLEALREALGPAPVGLCLVGDGAYDVRDVQRSLGGDFILAVHMPEDRRSAKVLSDGAPPPGAFGTKPLMREAAAIAKTLLRSTADVASPKTVRTAPGRFGGVA